MSARDLALLIEAATEAGDIAKTFWRNDPKSWEKAPGDPVGEADLAANAVLRARLRDARPDYGWMSEEDEDEPERQFAERVFIVDPIDGTKSFLKGEENWGVAVAVAENGSVTAGAFVMPAKDTVYAAASGNGASRNGSPIVIRAPNEPPEVLTARTSFDEKNWPGGVMAHARAFRPSLIYRFALVAEGRFDMTLTLRDAWEWDLAAGAIIASEAGARVSDRTGQPIVFNTPMRRANGALAAHPDLARATLAGTGRHG